MKYWKYDEEQHYTVYTCERPDIVLDEIVRDFNHRFPDSKNRSISIDICEWTLDPKFILRQRVQYRFFLLERFDGK